jgi:D-arabinose 1-dehydrogenase-like Zn-dependent alcohol dehydrogenase
VLLHLIQNNLLHIFHDFSLFSEVQIKVHSCGICGSDVHYWKNGAMGDFIVDAPMILGHESSGIVSKLGPGVTNLQVGESLI